MCMGKLAAAKISLKVEENVMSLLILWSNAKTTHTGNNQHHWNCIVRKAKGSCICSQLPPMSATSGKKFNLMYICNIVTVNFVAEANAGYTCNVLVS